MHVPRNTRVYLQSGTTKYIVSCEGMRTTYSVVELSAGDSFLGIDLAMSHSLEGRVGDTAPVRLSAGCALDSLRSPPLLNSIYSAQQYHYKINTKMFTCRKHTKKIFGHF